jgi:hypothetical protein
MTVLILYLPAFTYLFSDNGVVLSRASQAIVQLTSASTSSASRGILLICNKNISKLCNLLFLMNNYFVSHLWSIKNCRHLGSRKRIPAGDNTIMPIWTNGMSCLHEIRMKKSEMLWTTRDIDDGMTSMGPLADHFDPTRRVICYLLYHRQQRFLTSGIFLTHLQ